jgi:2'-5' RNA ligase
MIRLFVALALPTLVKTQLGALAGGIPGAKWVPPENYHLTLRFIGEIEAWRAEEVDTALAAIRAPRFELALAGIGTFEKAGRIQSLHVPAERSETLARLQGKVETALQRIGLEPERKRFAPHVALARTDRAETHKLISFVQTHALFRIPPVSIEHFTLFSSRLGKEAAHYIPEVEYELA